MIYNVVAYFMRINMHYIEWRSHLICHLFNDTLLIVTKFNIPLPSLHLQHWITIDIGLFFVLIFKFVWCSTTSSTEHQFQFQFCYITLFFMKSFDIRFGHIEWMWCKADGVQGPISMWIHAHFVHLKVFNKTMINGQQRNTNCLSILGIAQAWHTKQNPQNKHFNSSRSA